MVQSDMKEEDSVRGWKGEMEPANSVSVQVTFSQSQWKHWRFAKAVQAQHTFIPKYMVRKM